MWYKQNDNRRIHCIVPPHILDAIARNGTKEEREAALDTLSFDHTFRAYRAAGPQIQGPIAQRNVLHALSLQEQDKKRTVYDAQHKQVRCSGKVVRNEGQGPTGDKAVDEAYDGLGATYDLYWDVFGRNSIDDNGMALNGTVHYGTNYNNAFWDGACMAFGDGDGQIFNRFTIAVDVMGHELTHGVTENEAGLVYYFQPGALNESISDVFGSLVKQYVVKQTASQADWLIGAGLFTPQVQGVALRSMKAPGTAYDDPKLGKDPQPAHMKDLYRGWSDNGGVHINSGIPNHAFYHAAINLGGYAWEKAGHIWYETLRDPRLKKTTTFKPFAKLTVSVAGKLYGVGGVEQKAVRDAWSQVGISA